MYSHEGAKGYRCDRKWKKSVWVIYVVIIMMLMADWFNFLLEQQSVFYEGLKVVKKIFIYLQWQIVIILLSSF